MDAEVAPAIRLVGTDERLLERIEAAVPEGIEVTRTESLDRAKPARPPFALTVYCTDRFDEREQERIKSFLREHPRRIAVVCREAEVGDVFQLGLAGGTRGLVAVETDRSRDRLLELIPRWYWGGVIRPDWTGLGAGAGELQPRVESLHRLLEARPFHDWRVAELADRLRVSSRTLNRAVQSAHGRSVKKLLQDVRSQVLESVRATGELKGKEMAALFGFESPEDLHPWRRRHRAERCARAQRVQF